MQNVQKSILLDYEILYYIVYLDGWYKKTFEKRDITQ